MRHALSTILAGALLATTAGPSAAEGTADHQLMHCGYLCTDEGPLITSGTGEPPPTELVRRLFLGAFSETCSWAISGGPAQWEPEVYDFTFRPAYLMPDDADRDLRLYRFFCGAGAYNERYVYMTWTNDDGVRPVSFAIPSYVVDYVPDDIDGRYTGIAVTGMAARQELVNSELDPATGRITEWSCWRGLCDASSRGEWVLDQDGRYRLVTYDVDPSYDGEVNLIRLVDFGQPIEVDISMPLPFDPGEYYVEDEEGTDR